MLDLESEEYFSLDEVGARMLEVLAESESIGAACATLLSEYEVEPEVLEQDLLAYITALNSDELVEIIYKEFSCSKKLSGQERSLFLQAYLLLPLVTVSLKLGGLGRTQTILARLSPLDLHNISYAQNKNVRVTTKMVKIADKYSKLWSNCLRQSLVLWYLLRRQGVSSELRIGVRRQEGEFQSHAWIEFGNIVLNDRSNVRQQYTVFKQLHFKG
ncbi:MAG: lasso peptide biosynthesis B2 protein [Prochloron sp. SP5CPC1]|nr:lasso peptide biosynthesis B2 protein [Candidatus Paraprochloron terpiosi SP5CPC1]